MPKEIIYIIVLIIAITLLSNKTFFYQRYEINEDIKLFIPRFSFLYRKTDSVAMFFTLKTEKHLNKEICLYYQDSPDLRNNYKIENKKAYRKIYLSITKEDV